MSIFPVRFRLVTVMVTVLMGGCESLPDLNQVLKVPTPDDVLSTQTIAAGLREALEVGSGRAVESLGRPGGFFRSAFHIPLPDPLLQAQQVAERFALGGIFDDVELKLNRAAEAAAPKAEALFVNAIRQLTFADVMAIYQGSDDAATHYLRRTTETALRAQMKPVVASSLADVGALTAFTAVASQYNRLPGVTPIEADLTEHVLTYASNAIFARLAAEEAAIRRNPAKRTTQLLRQVFG